MRFVFAATVLALTFLVGCSAPAAPAAPTSPPAPSVPKPAATTAAAPTTAPAAAPTKPAAASTAAPSPATSTQKPTLVNGKLAPLPDGYPNQPVTAWTDKDPGSDDDIFNKLVADLANKYSPVRIGTAVQPIASLSAYGMVDYMKTQPGAADGYQIRAGPFSGPTVRLYTVDALKNKKLEDIQPILSMEGAPFVFVVPLNSPFKSMQDVAEYKNNPLKVVGSSTGSNLHMSLEIWRAQANVNFTFIPSKNGAESRTVLLGGGAQFGCLTYSPDIQQSLRVLAVTGDRRVSALPDVPSAADLGFTIPTGTERGYLTVPGVAPARVNWLFQLFTLVAQDPEFAARRKGFEVMIKDANQVRQFQEEVVKVFVPLIKELGIKVD